MTIHPDRWLATETFGLIRASSIVQVFPAYGPGEGCGGFDGGGPYRVTFAQPVHHCDYRGQSSALPNETRRSWYVGSANDCKIIRRALGLKI